MSNKASWSRPYRAEYKRIKHEESEARKAEHDKLTTLQKIEKLDHQLGPNVGAIKERARLKVILEKEFKEKEQPADTKKKEKTKRSNKAPRKAPKKTSKKASKKASKKDKR